MIRIVHCPPSLSLSLSLSHSSAGTRFLSSSLSRSLALSLSPLSSIPMGQGRHKTGGRTAAMTYDPSVRATHFACARTRRGGGGEQEKERKRKGKRERESAALSLSRSLALSLSRTLAQSGSVLIPFLVGLRLFAGVEVMQVFAASRLLFKFFSLFILKFLAANPRPVFPSSFWFLISFDLNH